MEINRYKFVLAGLVGSSDPKELTAMKLVIDTMKDGPEEDKQKILAAIDLLLRPPNEELIAWRDRLRRKNGFLVLAKSDRVILEALIENAL